MPRYLSAGEATEGCASVLQELQQARYAMPMNVFVFFFPGLLGKFLRHTIEKEKESHHHQHCRTKQHGANHTQHTHAHTQLTGLRGAIRYFMTEVVQEHAVGVVSGVSLLLLLALELVILGLRVEG